MKSQKMLRPAKWDWEVSWPDKVARFAFYKFPNLHFIFKVCPICILQAALQTTPVAHLASYPMQYQIRLDGSDLGAWYIPPWKHHCLKYLANLSNKYKYRYKYVSWKQHCLAYQANLPFNQHRPNLNNITGSNMSHIKHIKQTFHSSNIDQNICVFKVCMYSQSGEIVQSDSVDL